jgi:hypothetical protein
MRWEKNQQEGKKMERRKIVLSTTQIAKRYGVSSHVIGMMLCKCVVFRVAGIWALPGMRWEIEEGFRIPTQTALEK